MNAQTERLQFLCETVQRECKHLLYTDQHLFALAFDQARAQQLYQDQDLAERVDAFVSRFARLQDTLGDKLLPQLLKALAEPMGAVLHNLDRAERLGWIESADEWLTTRNLRNQMVHEYIRDPAVLSNALQSAHAFVPVLLKTADQLIAQAQTLIRQ